MPKEGVQKKTHGDIMRIEEIVMLAKTLVDLGFWKIRLTGGEPLVRKGVLSLTEQIGKLKGLRDFSLTTNGALLSKYAKDLKDNGIKRINISLDSLKADRYKQITTLGDIGDVFKGIEAATNCGMRIKLNAVLIGGFNTDEIKDFVDLTKESAIDIRFIELMKFGTQSDWTIGKYVSTKRVLDEVPGLLPVNDGDKSSAAVYYKLPGSQGKVGLIRPISDKFCDYCNRLRVTADGKIKVCLHSDIEVSIKDKLNDAALLRQAIIDAINLKPYEHGLVKGEYSKRGMSRIGG